MRVLWLSTYFLALTWSAISPHDYFTWFLEAAPALVGFLIVAGTYRRFPLTPVAYTLILIHCMILFLGAHYTYAEVETLKPIRQFMGWQRNNFDKIGHFAQGFVPALIAREILIRNAVVNGRAWLNLFVISICLAFGSYFLDCLFSDIDSLVLFAGIHQIVYGYHRCLSKRFPFASTTTWWEN